MADRYWISKDSSKSYRVGNRDGLPEGIFFKPDGTKMYFIGASYNRLVEYDLTTAWDISTAVYVQQIGVGGQTGQPTDVFFKPDGLKMYVLGFYELNEYDLSTAWDISTAVFLQVTSFPTSMWPEGVSFKPDGTKVYICDARDDRIYEYDLSTAWDISTITLLQFKAIADGNITGLYFRDDGIKLYFSGDAGNRILEYDLTTAWDVSTAVYLQQYSVSSLDATPVDVFLKPDGTVLYFAGNSTDYIYSLPIDTPWDISTIYTGVWDGNSEINWSETSGGPTGASVPTTSDNVFVDANSGSLITVATGNTGAASIDFSGFTGQFAGSAALNVNGNVTLNSAMDYAYTGDLTITGTGTLTSAGKTLTSNVVVNAAASTVTLGDALDTSTKSLTITNGTFDTAGYNCTVTSLLSSNTNVRTINLNSSVVTVSNTVDFTDSTNLTLSSGTSQLNLSSVSAKAYLGGKTYNDVSFTNTSIGVRELSGQNTFSNLTLDCGSAGLTQLKLYDNQTITGTFDCSGPSPTYRTFLLSAEPTVAKTITANSMAADNCDFSDITVAGNAAPLSPVCAGDCFGNTNIVFPSPKTVYRVGDQIISTTLWSLTPGGTGSVDNFPLAQDTVELGSSITYDVAYNLGNISVTGGRVTNPVVTRHYGDVTYSLSSSMTANNGQIFYGRKTMTYIVNRSLRGSITVDAPNGTLKFGNAIGHTTQSTNIIRGTLDTNDYNYSIYSFNSNSSNEREILFRSSVISLGGSSTTVWNTSDTTNLTFDAGTSEVRLTSANNGTRTVNAGGVTFNKFVIQGARAGSSVNILGQNNFNELTSLPAVAYNLIFSASQGTINTWKVTGNPGALVTVRSNSSGTRRTFNLTNITEDIDYLNVKDIGVNQEDLFYVGSNSTDSGNNLNVIFTDPPPTATGNFFMLF